MEVVVVCVCVSVLMWDTYHPYSLLTSTPSKHKMSSYSDLTSVRRGASHRLCHFNYELTYYLQSLLFSFALAVETLRCTI